MFNRGIADPPAVRTQGYAFQRNIGTKGMSIKGIEINSHKQTAQHGKVHWDSKYENKDGEEIRIEFDVTYLLQKKGGELKILGYITGDEQSVLKEHLL